MTQNKTIKPWTLLMLEELIYHLYMICSPFHSVFLCLYAYLPWRFCPSDVAEGFFQRMWMANHLAATNQCWTSGPVDPTATGCMKFPVCRHQKHNFPINFRSIQKKWFCEVLHNCQRMIEAQSSSHLTVKNPNYFETIENIWKIDVRTKCQTSFLYMLVHVHRARA